MDFFFYLIKVSHQQFTLLLVSWTVLKRVFQKSPVLSFLKSFLILSGMKLNPTALLVNNRFSKLFLSCEDEVRPGCHHPIKNGLHFLLCLSS